MKARFGSIGLAVSRLTRPCALFCSIAVASACSPGGRVVLEPAAGGIGSPQTILFATSREPEPPLFGPGRSNDLDFGRIVVSVPPDRSGGQVTWPSGAAASARTDFLITSGAIAPNPAAFASVVDRELAASGGREAIVFVHGYNTTFAEGLYRQAQMRHDFGLPDLSVYYSWPSAGALTGYVYDKESAIFGAEGLADLMSCWQKPGSSRSRSSGIRWAGS
jgi:esterase/lipase superfamily enzyme